MLEHLARSFHSSAVYRKIPPFVSGFPAAVLSWPSGDPFWLCIICGIHIILFSSGNSWFQARALDSGLLCSIVQLHFTFARLDMSDVMHVISADQTKQWEKEKCIVT